MGGKKKSMANKLAKMSEEDRARYLQHKADQEEEIRRRKEQLINNFLKNKVKKEDAFARLNVAKINENWHQIMRKVKSDELREEVEFLQGHSLHLLEMKNRNIDTLMQELDEVEEHYSNNFETHMNSIKKILEFSQKAVQDISNEHHKELEDLMKKNRTERKLHVRQLKDQDDYMKKLLAQNKLRANKELRENYDYYYKITDDVINQNKKEFEEMRKAKEKQMTEIWESLYKVLKDYVLKTDQKRAHLAELETLDQQSQVEIAKNEIWISRKQETLETLQKKHKASQNAMQHEQFLLAEYSKILKKEFEKQKQNLSKLLQLDQQTLNHLVQTSNASLKFLSESFKKLENILNLIQICRKFETQEEKVLKFGSANPFADYATDFFEEAPLSPSIPDSLQKTVGTTKKLDKFWINYNKVLFSMKQMQSEEKALRKENEKLKEEIRFIFEQKIYQEVDMESKEKAKKHEKELIITFEEFPVNGVKKPMTC